MLSRSLMKETEVQIRADIESSTKACLLAAALALALAAGAAVAKPFSLVDQDKAQIRADEHMLSAAQAKLHSDVATLRADTKEGRMAAESKDAERVYLDPQGIKGERKDITADKSGSVQMKEDETALAREEHKLDTDTKNLKADTEEGKMAAQSKDAERVYKDRQAINGARKDFTSDKAQLIADEKLHVATASAGHMRISQQRDR